MTQEPICRHCRHFYITWDAKAPNGCRAYQFKGPSLPSVVVKKESGLDCMKFAPKLKDMKKAGELDLNDDSLWE